MKQAEDIPPLILVRDLTKIFRIYNRPSDRIREIFSFGFRARRYTEHTALRGLSFQVSRGEFLGILGRNGAGKSTLLKILSGELAPSSGDVQLSGSVALLQLGIGFNSELSGLENAKFASKLMGISDRDLDEVLHKIAEFADIGEFIHRPVKTYSSGMYSRLSFATAINVNPDILIADEVLAVGDMRFTQKCLRKMREFKELGKTVILVTHDIETVNAFCDRAMWIKDGLIFQEGPAKIVSEHYKNFMLYDRLPSETGGLARTAESPRDFGREADPTASWVPIDFDLHKVIGHGGAFPLAVSFNTESSTSEVMAGEYCRIQVKFRCETQLNDFVIGLVITDKLGQVIIHLNNQIAGVSFKNLELQREYVVSFGFAWPQLNRGSYSLTVGAQEIGGDELMLWRAHDVVVINVERAEHYGDQHGLVLIEGLQVACN